MNTQFSAKHAGEILSLQGLIKKPALLASKKEETSTTKNFVRKCKKCGVLIVNNMHQ